MGPRRSALFAVEQVEFFAGFEADCFAGGDGYLGAGARIAADAGLSGADVEDSEAAQLDALSVGEGFFEALEDRVHGGFSLHAGQASPFDHVMDDVLFNQCLSPQMIFVPASCRALERC